jgi:hypothetical protein
MSDEGRPRAQPYPQISQIGRTGISHGFTRINADLKQKAEGRRQKAVGRSGRQTADGRRQTAGGSTEEVMSDDTYHEASHHESDCLEVVL